MESAHSCVGTIFLGYHALRGPRPIAWNQRLIAILPLCNTTNSECQPLMLTGVQTLAVLYHDLYFSHMHTHNYVHTGQ